MKNKKYEEDFDLLEQLVNLADKKNLSEIEFKKKYKDENEIFIKISKISTTAIDTDYKFSNTITKQNKPEKTEIPTNNDDVNELKNQPGIISSPMVGTIYLSPEPGESPFIKIGQNVNIGDTLFIIEAMKTMNQIPSPKSGKVKRILIDDATPVEFDSPLVIIE
ncbi:MAG: acetyl-CoA carboxylase biotin carboxyl carrier protein [Paracoccaceae bacterium]